MELIHVQHLRDGTEEVRLEATRVLARIGDERAVEPLIEALRDDSADVVREGAAYALGSIGDERAVEPLIEALRDDSADVRGAAARAFGIFGEYYDDNFEDEPLPRSFIDAVEPPLIEALRDDNANVRKNAARSIIWVGGMRAIGPLQELQLGDNDRMVRAAAKEAIGDIERYLQDSSKASD